MSALHIKGFDERHEALIERIQNGDELVLINKWLSESYWRGYADAKDEVDPTEKFVAEF